MNAQPRGGPAGWTCGSARHAVQAIVAGRRDKQAVWSVNIDDSYHEETESAG
ncbi:hypothetical protein [Pseudaquabacterium rugosum]|uniref:Uncharacterized protein n=1 Tax=Pseudaquabacterium rugosum TaxID=2984194 RepID=A0ABU9BFH9_9BURK